MSRLLQAIPFFGLGPRGGMSVRVPGMAAGTQLRWERRLSFWLGACGCQAGALLAVSALVWRVSVVLHQPPQDWGTVAAHLGWVFGAALIGKLGGLAIARAMLVLDLKRLSRGMSTRSALSSELRP